MLVGFLVGGFFCGPGCCPQTLANIHASLTTTPIGTVLRKPRGNSLLPATGLHKPRQHQGLPTWPPSRWFPVGNLGLQMGSQRRGQVRDDGGGAEHVAADHVGRDEWKRHSAPLRAVTGPATFAARSTTRSIAVGWSASVVSFHHQITLGPGGVGGAVLVEAGCGAVLVTSGVGGGGWHDTIPWAACRNGG